MTTGDQSGWSVRVYTQCRGHRDVSFPFSLPFSPLYPPFFLSSTSRPLLISHLYMGSSIFSNSTLTLRPTSLAMGYDRTSYEVFCVCGFFRLPQHTCTLRPPIGTRYSPDLRHLLLLPRGGWGFPKTDLTKITRH